MYRRTHALLEREGERVNHKRLGEEMLRIPTNANSDSERQANRNRAEGEQISECSDAGIPIVE